LPFIELQFLALMIVKLSGFVTYAKIAVAVSEFMNSLTRVHSDND